MLAEESFYHVFGYSAWTYLLVTLGICIIMRFVHSAWEFFWCLRELLELLLVTCGNCFFMLIFGHSAWEFLLVIEGMAGFADCVLVPDYDELRSTPSFLLDGLYGNRGLLFCSEFAL